MVIHLSTRRTQFSYYDQVLAHPVWKGRKILDFGGNVGGFLAEAGYHVDHDDYWCLDLTEGAIAQGRRDFPRAHFVFYNRYASYFNPDGVRFLPVPNLGLKFEIILAFSVFTHTHQKELLVLVDQLRRMLSAGGVMALTFCDPYYDRSRSDSRLAVGAGVLTMAEVHQAQSDLRAPKDGVETARRPNWYAVVDGRLYIEPGKELCQQQRRGKREESYCSYFTPDYMTALFPDATVHPPVCPDWQHCCILKNND